MARYGGGHNARNGVKWPVTSLSRPFISETHSMLRRDCLSKRKGQMSLQACEGMRLQEDADVGEMRGEQEMSPGDFISDHITDRDHGNWVNQWP